MVLHHVAHGAGAVVVGAAVLHAEGFADADLHVVDVPGAPDRLEQTVGEAQGHQVLYGFLAQVVVDAEHLGFVEYLADGGIDRLRRFQRTADGFFQHDARLRRGHAGDGQVRGDVLEQVGRGGQVVHPTAAGIGAQVARQTAEIGALGRVHGEVIESLGEAAPGFGGEIGAGHLGPAAALGQGAEAVAVEGVAGQGEDAHLRMQATFAVKVIEGREQLVQREIAGAAEDEHVAGAGQGRSPSLQSDNGWCNCAEKRLM
ncbi:hypothetical protein D9M71_126100 [compost metagenome]